MQTGKITLQIRRIVKAEIIFVHSLQTCKIVYKEKKK